MTDNEIVKAVDMCRSSTSNANCGKCPYSEHEEDCIAFLCADAFDLINRTKAKEKHYRQKVQNQRVTINSLECKIDRQKAEIERLQGAVQEWVDGKCLSQKHLLMIGKLQNEIETAKAEAIKEFAERLKAEADGYDFCGDGIIYQMVDTDDIDNLVKEMVGNS